MAIISLLLSSNARGKSSSRLATFLGISLRASPMGLYRARETRGTLSWRLKTSAN